MIKKITDYKNPPLEELMKITEPTLIVKNSNKKPGKNYFVKLYPFNDVKQGLQDFIETRHLTKIDNAALIKNFSLFGRLSSWSYILSNGTCNNPEMAIFEMGFELNSEYKNPSSEELMSMKEGETANILIHSNKNTPTRGKYARIVTVYPFETVKNELLDWIEKHNYTTINQDVMKKNNPNLFHKLTTLSYALNGTFSVKKMIQKMGLDTMNERQTLDEYRENILKLFPEDFILDFLDKGKTKNQRMEYIRNAPKNLRSAYEARKWRTKQYNLSVVDIIDKAYPHIVEQTGLLPSQILWLTPFSEDTISDLVNKLYYDGQDIRSESQAQTPAGKKLVYFTRYTDNRPQIPVGSRGTRKSKYTQKKAVKRAYSKEVLKYFRQRIFKDQRVLENYLLDDVGSRRDLAFLSEIEFSVFMRILAKYDPELKNFPELLEKIKIPIQSVYDPTISNHRRIMHEQIRSADGRFNAGGYSYLVELKTTEYSTSKQFFKSLSKYTNVTHWWDGGSIDDKILLIDKSINGTARKMSQDWKVMRGEEFDTLYRRALNILYFNELELGDYSPMTSFDSLMQIHELLHQKSYILRRKGHRALRKIMEFAEMKLFNHLDSLNGIYQPYARYSDEYSFNLNQLGVYPKDVIHNVPENMLFLDLETTGFRNSGIQTIMATVGERKGDDFQAKLYFARTPFEEKALLEKLIHKIESADEIVTYNGKNFDLPLVEERSFVHMIRYLCNKKHTDLYTGYYKDMSVNKKFPRSKLKTFERTELKLDRRGDVNGSAIPDIYLNYLLGEDDDTMMHVISHNFLDVFSMPFVYLHSHGYRFDTTPVEVNLQNFNGLFKH